MRFRNAVLVGLLAIVLGFSGFLPLGGGLLGSFAALGWARWLFNLSGSGKFVKVSLGPDVYRWGPAVPKRAAAVLAAALEWLSPRSAVLPRPCPLPSGNSLILQEGALAAAATATAGGCIHRPSRRQICASASPRCPPPRRLDLWWRPLPFALLPLTSILIKDASGSWVLIDAGAGDSWSQSYATRLAAAVKVALPRGAQLEAILRE